MGIKFGSLFLAIVLWSSRLFATDCHSQMVSILRGLNSEIPYQQIQAMKSFFTLPNLHWMETVPAFYRYFAELDQRLWLEKTHPEGDPVFERHQIAVQVQIHLREQGRHLYLQRDPEPLNQAVINAIGSGEKHWQDALAKFLEAHPEVQKVRENTLQKGPPENPQTTMTVSEFLEQLEEAYPHGKLLDWKTYKVLTRWGYQRGDTVDRIQSILNWIENSLVFAHDLKHWLKNQNLYALVNVVGWERLIEDLKAIKNLTVFPNPEDIAYHDWTPEADSEDVQTEQTDGENSLVEAFDPEEYLAAKKRARIIVLKAHEAEIKAAHQANDKEKMHRLEALQLLKTVN